MLSHMIFCEEQLQFLLWLQGMRGPTQDAFFQFLNFFDTGYFFLVLISSVWIGFSRKWGLRTFYFVTLNTLLNAGAKAFFALPRPCHIIETLCLVPLKSHGFPSGGAQNAILIAGVLILYWKHRLAKPVALAYFLLISFSRLYLGVHFPIDVLGGWILGFISLMIFYFSIERIEKWAKENLQLMTILSIGVPLAIWGCLANAHLSFFMAACTGTNVGVFLSRSLHQIPERPRNLKISLIRAVFGVTSTYAVYFFSHNLFATYVWVTWLAGLCIRSISMGKE